MLLFARYQNILLLKHGFKSTGNATTTQVKWKVYVNTKYGYTLQYPESVYLQVTQDMDPFSVEESASIEMGVRGTADVGIQITAWAPYTYQTTDKTALEYNRIARLDLKSFSETLRQKEIDDKNPNFPEKRVSALEEISLAGHRAYSVIVSGYTDGRGSDTFKYIYINNGTNNLVIQYSLKGDLSKEIINSFKFTK